MTRSVMVLFRTMSSRSGKSRLLVCCFCKFETCSKGGFAWHQTVLHGRSGGNGIPGLKRRRSTELSEDGEEDEEGGSANPSARPRTRRRGDAPETLAAAASGAAGGGVGGDDEQRASPACDDAVFGTGALAPDDVGSYNTAIRNEMYPLLAMTTGLDEAGLQRNGGGASAGELPQGVGYEYQTLATQLRCLYEVLDDAARAVPIALRVKRSRAGQFNTTRLRALQLFVLGVGGAGLSVREQRLLYNFLDVWDRHDLDNAIMDDDDLSLRAVFPTVSSFTNALRDDLNQAVLDAGWKKLRLQEGGIRHTSGRFSMSPWVSCTAARTMCACGAVRADQHRRLITVRLHRMGTLFGCANKKLLVLMVVRVLCLACTCTVTAASCRGLGVSSCVRLFVRLCRTVWGVPRFWYVHVLVTPE